jgi:hypothetical protein
LVWANRTLSNLIELWVKNSDIEIPKDLLEIWSLTGGGDCCEGETFFRPTSIPSAMPYFVEEDDFETASTLLKKNGMSPQYLAFHDGLYLSAIRRSDSLYVVLNERYEELGVYNHLNNWYESTMRADFAERYGSPNLG